MARGILFSYYWENNRCSEKYQGHQRKQTFRELEELLASSLGRHGTCWLVDLVQPMVAWIVLILGWNSPLLAVGTWGHLGPMFGLISPASLC